MGKGTSKARGSTGGGVIIDSSVKLLKMTEEEIDLSSSPLIYGKKDSSLTEKARAVIENFEREKYNASVEHNILVDDDGNIIEQNVGKDGEVSASLNARLTADVYSHNHNRRAGVLGGTFSDGDMENFIRFNQRTYRATAKEGTYSISKGKDFDKTGKQFVSDFRKYGNKLFDDTKNRVAKLDAKFSAGKIDYETYIKMHNKLNNRMFVGLHNWLLKKQKKYNYSYTLEQR